MVLNEIINQILSVSFLQQLNMVNDEYKSRHCPMCVSPTLLTN
jgi:hypothetical protein